MWPVQEKPHSQWLARVNLREKYPSGVLCSHMATRTRLGGRFTALSGISLLRHQLFLAVLSLLIGIVFWFFQRGNSFVQTAVYTFVIGNVTYFPTRIVGSALGNTTPLRRWLVFVTLLLTMGAVGGTVAGLAVYSLTSHSQTTALLPYLRINLEVALFITMVTGTVMFGVISVQMRLQKANQLLETQVQLGTLELQDQAAELTTAHEIQAHLIPLNLPQIPGLQVAGAWQPASAVGGDYFDGLAFAGGQLGLCIADVSGKGMGAALLMANLQAAFRAFATEEAAPAAVCGKLNRALCASIAPGKFVTFFYGVIDTASLTMRYENAGHNPPALLREGAAAAVPDGGTVLGLFPEAVYAERTLQLRPGDCLLLTTDGITEAAHPDRLEDEFGDARLLSSALSVRSTGAHGIRSRILEDVTLFCAGHFRDDASLIVVTVAP
jgi:sigma-B regulation protein RsbU (phosphoserine phosphatase)